MLKAIDNLNGFALALLSAIPMLNVVFETLPNYVKAVPIFLLVAITIFLITTRNTRPFRADEIFYFLCILLFISSLLLSTWWVSSRIYYQDDLVNLAIITIITVAVFVSFNMSSATYFLKWVIFFGILSTYYLIQSYISAGSLRGYNISDQYLVLSQSIGAGTVVCFTGALTTFRNTKFYLFLSLILFTGLALALGRSALLSSIFIAVITWLLYLLSKKKKNYSINDWIKNNFRTLFGIAFILLTVTGVIFIAFQVERTAGRLIRMFTGNELAAGGRGELWMNALKGISESPLIGYGLGSSGLISSMKEGYYPHNLFLQTWLDAGVLAFITLLIICWYPLYRAIIFRLFINKKNLKWVPLIGYYCFLFLEYSKSTDFYEARMFFVIGIISLIVIPKIKGSTIFKSD